MNNKYIQINEEGFFHFGDDVITDPKMGAPLLNNIYLDEQAGEQWATKIDGTSAFIECFDQPLVAKNVECVDGQWNLILPYGQKKSFSPHSLKVDEWDRFHGTSDDNVLFVFSRAAQADFFNLLDEFDDDSVTINGEQISVPLNSLLSRPQLSFKLNGFVDMAQ